MAEGENGPEGTSNHELMQATARALAAQGFAELTTQRVADEWGKSQPLVHYYYDTKDDLIVGFIDHLRHQSKQNYDAHADDDPVQRVTWLLKRHFIGPHQPQEPDFTRSLLEVQAQASHNERYRAAFEALDGDARDFLRTAIRDGIEAGVFRDVDVDATVTVLLSAVSGGILRLGVFDYEDTVDNLELAFDAYVEDALLAESVDPADFDLGGNTGSP